MQQSCSRAADFVLKETQVLIFSQTVSLLFVVLSAATAALPQPPLDPVYSLHPPPTPNHPQAWPVSGSQSKFKLQQGQLFLPAQGAFSVRGSQPGGETSDSVRETESKGEGERAAEERTGSTGLGPRDLHNQELYCASVWDYTVRGHLSPGSGACLRWRNQDGGQRRRGQAGHHE